MKKGFKFGEYGEKISRNNPVKCNCHNKSFYCLNDYEEHLDKIFLDPKKVKNLDKPKVEASTTGKRVGMSEMGAEQ